MELHQKQAVATIPFLAKLFLDDRPNPQTAHEKIKSLIVQGEFYPGEPLLLNRLSDKLNYSHTPIREALFRLSAEGLVDRIDRGFKVPKIRLQDMEARFNHMQMIVQKCLVSGNEGAGGEPLRISIDNADDLSADAALELFEKILESTVRAYLGSYWASVIKLLNEQTRCIRRIEFEHRCVQQKSLNLAFVNARERAVSPQLLIDSIERTRGRIEPLLQEFYMRAMADGFR